MQLCPRGGPGHGGTDELRQRGRPGIISGCPTEQHSGGLPSPEYHPGLCPVPTRRSIIVELSAPGRHHAEEGRLYEACSEDCPGQEGAEQVWTTHLVDLMPDHGPGLPWLTLASPSAICRRTCLSPDPTVNSSWYTLPCFSYLALPRFPVTGHTRILPVTYTPPPTHTSRGREDSLAELLCCRHPQGQGPRHHHPP